VSCTNGASVKSGLDPNQQVWVDRWLWEQATGTASSWLDPFLDAFVPVSIKLSDLCALNLSDPPLPSVTDIALAISGDPAAVLLITNWVRQKLEYYQFSVGCTCNPAPSTCAPLQYSAPFGQFGCSSPAGEYGNRFVIDSACVIRGATLWQTAAALPQGAVVDLWDNASPGSPIRTDTLTIGSGDHVTMNWTGGDFTPVVGNTYTVALRKVATSCYPGDVGTPSVTWSPYAHQTGDGFFSVGPPVFPSGALGARVGIEPLLCSPGTPTPPPPPVQPPQPPTLTLPPVWVCANIGDICTRLQQLSQRLDWLREMVQLIQRQRVPFAYVLGTTNAGLTGAGTLSVQGILGVSVSLTTVPSFWGRTNDTPARYVPKVGDIQMCSANGCDDEIQLHYASQIAWDLPPFATSLKYSLRPGIVASITTLLREP
jgi:hypothetical protein